MTDSCDEDNGCEDQNEMYSTRVTTLYICASIELLTSIGTSISSVPSLRLLESAICQRALFASSPPPEDLCKTTTIQSSMAHLLGVMSSFASLPNLLLTLPFSILSEHVDRRGILLANSCAGLMATMWILGVSYYPWTDLRLIWLSGLFDIFGGGASVAQVILRSMISESVESSKLSVVLYRLSGLNLLVRLVGTSFGSWLLQNGAASTILVGLSIHGLTIPLLVFLPRVSLPNNSSRVSNSGYEFCCHDDHNTLPKDVDKSSTVENFPQTLSESISSFKNLLFHNPASTTCLAIMFFSTISLSARSLLRPWMSKRYAWSLSTTGYILSLDSLLGSLVFFILQYLDSTSGKLSASAKRKQDIKVAKISLVFAISGTLILGLAEKRWQFILSSLVVSGGVGFLDALRAFFTTKMMESGASEGPKNVQRLYGAMEVVQYVALILAAPIWSVIYALAYRLGGVGMGLPFFGSAGFMVLVLAIIWQFCKT